MIPTHDSFVGLTPMNGSNPNSLTNGGRKHRREEEATEPKGSLSLSATHPTGQACSGCNNSKAWEGGTQQMANVATQGGATTTPTGITCTGAKSHNANR